MYFYNYVFREYKVYLLFINDYIVSAFIALIVKYFQIDFRNSTAVDCGNNLSMYFYVELALLGSNFVASIYFAYRIRTVIFQTKAERYQKYKDFFLYDVGMCFIMTLLIFTFVWACLSINSANGYNPITDYCSSLSSVTKTAGICLLVFVLVICFLAITSLCFFWTNQEVISSICCCCCCCDEFQPQVPNQQAQAVQNQTFLIQPLPNQPLLNQPYAYQNQPYQAKPEFNQRLSTNQNQVYVNPSVIINPIPIVPQMDENQPPMSQQEILLQQQAYAQAQAVSHYSLALNQRQPSQQPKSSLNQIAEVAVPILGTAAKLGASALTSLANWASNDKSKTNESQNKK